jgi:hypothetical protein
MAIAGKVAITPKGEWNANTAYTKLDLVFYENASYVAIQPSTGVEPTNESYWMLMVQSAGGSDLEGIINGDIQVGNAKTLDGHGAEYFFPKSGGEVNGKVGFVDLGDNNKKGEVFEYSNTLYLRNTPDPTNPIAFTELRVENEKAMFGICNDPNIGTIAKELLHTGNRLEFIGTVSGIDNPLTFDKATYKELYCELAYFGSAKVTLDIVPNGGTYHSGFETSAGTLGGSVNVRDNTIKATSFYYEDISRNDSNVTLSVWGKR